VVVANRTPERAAQMVANDPHATTLTLAEAVEKPPTSGTIVAVTASEQALLKRDKVAAVRDRLPGNQELLVIDLAMPPNVEPEVDALARVTLHGIEEMREEAEVNRQRRLEEMDRCEKLVDHQLETLRKHLFDRALSPAARSLNQSFQEMAEKAVKHSLGKDLSHLEAADREAIEKMANGLARRLVQVPLKGLKSAAWNHSSAVIDGFLKGLEGDNGQGEDSGR
jgi:glutamyl-tRNA reductase